MKIKQTISFDDVLLVPQYSEVTSRTEITLSQEMKGVGKLNLPIISAPMDTVTEVDMAVSMHKAGGLGIIHRYNTIAEQCAMVAQVIEKGATVGAAIGVTGDFVQRAQALRLIGVNLLCIDVAHGHHSNVRYAIETVRRTLGDDTHIMAGNVATLSAFNDLADWGANSIKVGIGGGSICSTRIKTGHGVPTLQSVLECAKSDRDAYLVADCGMRTSGDIVKALAAGADFVMLGSLLAAADESPGVVWTRKEDGAKLKMYRGMASKEAQTDWRGSYSSIEGISAYVRSIGPASDVLEELEVGIRSGLSYSGALSIREMQRSALFIGQSSASQHESSTHIRSRNA